MTNATSLESPSDIGNFSSFCVARVSLNKIKGKGKAIPATGREIP
jgi:hypothetical protein